MYTLENHQNNFNNDNHHQQYQNDKLSNTLSSLSSTSCIVYNDNNDLDELRIFLDENENDITDQDTSGYEVSEELSTKVVRRNSSLSLTSSSSSSVLLKSFHRPIQSASLKTSRPCRDINFTHNKVYTYPYPTKQTSNCTMLNAQSYKQQSKENLIPKNKHNEQYKTKNYHHTHSIIQMSKKNSASNQMKNCHSNNHNSLFKENPMKTEQLSCNTSSQDMLNKKLQSNRTDHKIDKQKIKEYKLQNKPFNFDKEKLTKRKMDNMNIQYCSINNSKTCSKKDLSSICTLNGNKHVQETTTDLCLMSNSMLSRPSTSNSSCKMYHDKKSNSLCSNDHQFNSVPSSGKDRRAISKAEDEKRQAIRKVQLLASEAALISARQKALELRQAKLLEIRKNLQFKHKQAEARRKAIEASKQQRFNQLSKQFQDSYQQKTISNHSQQQKYPNRPYSCGSHLIHNYQKMNNNSTNVSTSKNTNESITSTTSITTITTINTNNVTTTYPIGFGSSTPRFVCYTNKELMHFKHHPSIKHINNSNRMNTQLSNKIIKHSMDQFHNYNDKRIINSSRQNTYTKHSLFFKYDNYYYTNKCLIKSAHQDTTNCINNTDNKLYDHNWQSLSLYLDCDSIDTRITIENDQSVIPTEHHIHKTTTIPTTNIVDSNINSRKLNFSTQSTTLPSFTTKNSLEKSTNSSKSMRLTKQSSIQSLTSMMLSSSMYDSSKQSLPVKQNCAPLKNFNKSDTFKSRNINNTKHKIVHCQTENSHKLLNASKTNLKQMNSSDVQCLNKSFIDQRKPNSNERIEEKSIETLPSITTTITQGNVEKTLTDSSNSSPVFKDHHKIANLIIEEILKEITDENLSKITQSSLKTTDELFMKTDPNEAKVIKQQMESLSITSTVGIESSTLSLTSSLSTASSFSLLSNTTTIPGTVIDTLAVTTSIMQISPATITSTKTSFTDNSLTIPKTLQFDHLTMNIIDSNKQIVNMTTESILNKLDKSIITEQPKVTNNNDNETQIKNNCQSNLINIREKPIQIVHPFNSTNLSQSGRLVISLSAELAEREARKKRLEGIMSRIKLHSKDYNQTINQSSINKLTNTIQDIEQMNVISKSQQEITSVVDNITISSSTPSSPIYSSSLTNINSQETNNNNISTLCHLVNNINSDQNHDHSKYKDELIFHDNNDDHNSNIDKYEYKNQSIQSDSNNTNNDIIRNRISIIDNMLSSGRLDRNSRAAEVLITMITKNQSNLNENRHLENIHELDDVIISDYKYNTNTSNEQAS
ncbi:unnamed protein product [Schistosoma margrebowiei]|uniref:Uncharacterized protein n=1 Tax=Schistosoma margrebowiei TaxID=48269 RepID=A0AA85A1X0_9TREM|nr:unnamed protein product [Schistosoma margrebowiei]